MNRGYYKVEPLNKSGAENEKLWPQLKDVNSWATTQLGCSKSGSIAFFPCLQLLLIVTHHSIVWRNISKYLDHCRRTLRVWNAFGVKLKFLSFCSIKSGCKTQKLPRSWHYLIHPAPFVWRLIHHTNGKFQGKNCFRSILNKVGIAKDPWWHLVGTKHQLWSQIFLRLRKILWWILHRC